MQMPPLDPAILARRSEIVAALRAIVPACAALPVCSASSPRSTQSSALFGSSRKGGSEAFRRMVGVVKQGGVVGITPEGPHGPRMRAGIGAVKRSVARQCVVQRLPLVEAGGQDLEGGLAGGEQGFFHRAAAINRVGAAVMARYVLGPNEYRRNAQ